MSDGAPGAQDAAGPVRRPATVQEAKAVAHPLRLRILRLCLEEELSNKQLADRLDRDPGTVLYHVRQLVDAGLLAEGPPRVGVRGSREKPYRSTGRSWWLEMPVDDGGAILPSLSAFEEELREASPHSVAKWSRLALRLSPDDVDELGVRILSILDEYVRTDDERRGEPVYGGLFVLHRLAT